MNIHSTPKALHSEVKHDVFVYGTLKKDYWNHRFLYDGFQQPALVGTTLTAHPHWGLWCHDLPDGIPFMYHKPERGSKIQGEHWLVGCSAMGSVRAIEESYDETTIELEDGIVATCFIMPALFLPIGSQGLDFPAMNGIISWPYTGPRRIDDVYAY